MVAEELFAVLGIEDLSSSDAAETLLQFFESLFAFTKKTGVVRGGSTKDKTEGGAARVCFIYIMTRLSFLELNTSLRPRHLVPHCFVPFPSSKTSPRCSGGASQRQFFQLIRSCLQAVMRWVSDHPDQTGIAGFLTDMLQVFHSEVSNKQGTRACRWRADKEHPSAERHSLMSLSGSHTSMLFNTPTHRSCTITVALFHSVFAPFQLKQQGVLTQQPQPQPQGQGGLLLLSTLSSLLLVCSTWFGQQTKGSPSLALERLLKTLLCLYTDVCTWTPLV